MANKWSKSAMSALFTAQWHNTHIWNHWILTTFAQINTNENFCHFFIETVRQLSDKSVIQYNFIAHKSEIWVYYKLNDNLFDITCIENWETNKRNWAKHALFTLRQFSWLPFFQMYLLLEHTWHGTLERISLSKVLSWQYDECMWASEWYMWSDPIWLMDERPSVTLYCVLSTAMSVTIGSFSKTSSLSHK